jgi:PAS domain S-box-containing protein
MSRVLFIDDKPDNLAYLQALLVGTGITCATATNGEEALASARNTRPDAVVSDLLMPLMDGYTLLRHWKSDEVLHEVPFIVYTATYTDPEDEQLAMDLGADAFIQKTSQPDQLLDKLLLLITRERSGSARSARPLPIPQEAQLKQYNDLLVRKLEAKTLQLHASNRALLLEIAQRRELAATQTAILNALAAHVVLITASGIITAVNEAWCRFSDDNGLLTENHGVGADYLATCHSAADGLFPPESEVTKGILAVLSKELPKFELEYVCNSVAGVQWFRMIVTPMDGAGLTGAVIMHVDVTDRRGAELKLQESEAQYLQLLNSTAEGIYRLDSRGICTFCNPTAALLLGYQDPKELIGKVAHDHHHHSHPDGTSFPLAACNVHVTPRTDRGTHSDREVFFRADGSQFPVEYWSYPIFGGPDTAGTVVTFLDITLRRDLEAQFLQSQKMEAVGRLAGGVAHDFNNSLQVILSYAELLEDHLARDEVGTGINREIISAGRRAASLTGQLLSMSRKQPVRPVFLELSAVTSDVETMLRRTIGEDIKLNVTHALDGGTIEADRGHVEQCMINLANNARDAMPGGGELFITTSNFNIGPHHTPPRAFMRPGNYAMFNIRDTGSGMDAATQARIFEPFFTTKEPGKGTGLGLSTVSGVMKQSKGYVIVDSEPGKGSEFRLFFPIVDGAHQNTAPPESSPRHLNGSETVLLVEDEHSLRLVIANALRSKGYQVLEARDGETAIELASDPGIRIDLLLTDMILPKRTGLSVAADLRLTHSKMKVIYMSGYTDDFTTHAHDIDLQTAMLEKPFPIATLLIRIREILGPQL